jgi:hypothetical protein
MRALLGIDIARCPCCSEELHREVLRPPLCSSSDSRLPPRPAHVPPWDTS